MNSLSATNINQNNFDNVRISLALIVFFSHLSALTNNPSFWYFEKYADANFAVKAFFVISGFLVAKSFIGCNGALEFFEKRIRRIYPAYLGAVLLCLFIGLMVTNMNALDFLGSLQTLKYVAYNIIFLNFLQPTLPGVFTENHLKAMDGSLWTIKVEVMLYLCVPLLVYSFRRFKAVWVLVLVMLASVAWVYYFTEISTLSIGPEIARQFPGQLSYFVCGIFLFINIRLINKIQYIIPFALLALFLIEDPNAKLVIDPIVYSILVIFACLLNVKYVNFGKYGDVSYGIYLYHFPIIQLMIFFGFFDKNIYIGALLSLLSTILVSLVSWHYLEKPFLRRSSHYLQVAGS